MTRLTGMVLISLFLIGCGGGKTSPTSQPDGSGSSVTPIEWPPRSGKNDDKAAAITPEATLTIEVPEDEKLKWSGAQQPIEGRMLPTKGRFEVTDGYVISRVGEVQKKAKFGSWTYIRSTGENKALIGWGPCLTSGEVLVSNIFVQTVATEYAVDNSFEAEDFGENFTLIKLDPSKGHKLCIWYRPPDSGVQFFGGMVSFGNSEVHGKIVDAVADAASADNMLFGTTDCVGTTAAFGEHKLVLKANGWYSGADKVSH